VALLHLGTVDDRSGPSADTGNLVHSGVDHWHKNKQDDEGAVEFMRSLVGRFPLGDPDEAEKYLRPYFADPRNKEAEIVLCEQHVEFTLQQDERDPYGPIYVRGTLDQVRKDPQTKQKRLWDIKTGNNHTGWEMIHMYAAQQAAYVLGACQFLDSPVYPGGIIRPYDYRARSEKPPVVFWESPYTLADCSTILRSVRRRVYEVRAGVAEPVSGKHCSHCPAGGLGGCLQLFSD
jgi:hypothetical protein